MMKQHPSPEEWAPYLTGELPHETRRRLREHLDDCPECQVHLERWRRTVQRLPQWQLTTGAPPRWIPVAQQGMRWAAAAALILSLGFLGGRLSSRATSVPAAELTQLRAELATLETRLAQANRTELQSVAENLLDAMNAARVEDHEQWQSIVERLQLRQVRDVYALRHDLETVAASADDEIQQARLELTALAAPQRAPEPHLP